MASGSSAVCNLFVAGGIGHSGCLQSIFLPLQQFIVSQSGWWCPALSLSPINLSALIAIYLSSSLAGSSLALWLSVFTCRPVVFHLSLRCLPDGFPRCGFRDVVSQVPEGFLGCCLVVFHLSWRGWFPNCLPIAFHNSHLSPRIGLPIVSKRLPLVAPLFPSRLSRCCFPHLVVSRLSCKCGLPIVSVFVPDVLS